MSENDYAPRFDMRDVVLVLNELVNGGARICTPEERKEALSRANAALERLKDRYGLSAGRGDTREETIEDRIGAILKVFT